MFRVFRAVSWQVMVVVYEEEEPVASSDGLKFTVKIKEIELSPGGSRRPLRSKSYNYKEAAEGVRANYGCCLDEVVGILLRSSVGFFGDLREYGLHGYRLQRSAA